MKTLLSKICFLALATVCLSSCYYSSTVPLSEKSDVLDEALQGTWEMQLEKNEKGNLIVNILPEIDSEGYNGELLAVEIDSNNQAQTEYHKLKITTTTIDNMAVLNIGVDIFEPDGEYFFGKYTIEGKRLSLFYVSEQPFKNEHGEIQKYTSSDMLFDVFKRLISRDDFFNDKPVIFNRPN